MSNYLYDIPGTFQGTFERHVSIIGDKKGDRSTFYFSKDSFEAGFFRLRSLQKAVGLPFRYLHVLRNPYDQVATNMLKEWWGHFGRWEQGVEGGAIYNTKLIESLAPIKVRKIPARYSFEEIISMFASSYQTNEQLKSSGAVEGIGGVEKSAADRIIKEHWLDLYSEDLIAEPDREIRRLCAFLGLETTPEYLDATAQRVLTQPHATRFLILWPPSILQRMESLIRSLPMYHRYAGTCHDCHIDQATNA